MLLRFISRKKIRIFHRLGALLPAAFIVSTCLPGVAQISAAGIFDGHGDVGSVLHPGSVAYDAAHRSYTVKGSGENMWMRKDAFFFVYKKVSGDVTLSGDIRFPKAGGSAHRKAAFMLRESLEPNAVYADAALHGSGLTALQYRSEQSNVTGDIELDFGSITDAPSSFRIEKTGDHVSMYIGKAGEPLRPSGASLPIHFGDSYYVGLAVCSHDKDVSEEAIFSNVVLKQAKAVTTENPELHSTLQTISLDPDAHRATEVLTATGHFEAPNWSRDGKTLIFDQVGKMMRVATTGGRPEPIETGEAVNCNGSHGLSPDGKSLAITCNTQGGPGSRVYIIPIEGGKPRLVTENPSSYFHSWSPDGKTIAFARPHPGGGDIFSISVDGGKETRLTTSTISDDPDYSPDGKYIYFNSDRGGGTMQIWRMNADGSQPEQITSDERNNWTPHVSPDGKSMVYLSYDHSVTGHPANKDICLKVMALDGSKTTRVLVSLVGGTGTINVPSWSPDSKNVAFVSYELIFPEAK